MSWMELSEWWRAELEQDPAYDEVVTPLLLSMLEPEKGSLYLDLGCGEGRVMRAVEARGGATHGIDLNEGLLRGFPGSLVARLPRIPLRDGSYDGLYCVLTLEHVEDHWHLFAEAGRVTKGGGVMALVMNHPVWTAPDSTPITDGDGEVLWRPGEYFSEGSTVLPAGSSEVIFYHRPMFEIFNAAATAGWRLDRMNELPHTGSLDQPAVPRLLACRWRKTA